ncbi:MAG TPA: Rne/Rng family ribonuclease [Candidatus Kapabacteria bacterium]|nr:Rne/Rng family ribonuclease [Candidatus Kapabacteria bacterium]
MKKEIIINSAINDTRIAITEDGELAEYLIELPNKERFIGNIYYGKVSKIVQGLNAAFIDLGLNQDAFLHFSDVEDNDSSFVTEEDDSENLDENNGTEVSNVEDTTNQENNATTLDTSEENTVEPSLEESNLNTDIDDAEVTANNEEVGDIVNSTEQKSAKFNKHKNAHTFKTKKSGEVKINLQEGKMLLVQVTREAYAKKGMKVSSKIALPGRYLVLLPFEKMVGVSKKISSYQERKRLRSIIKELAPNGYGCIIRTASKGQTEEELRKDWEELLAIWQELEAKYKSFTKPALVYQDMQLTASVIRDLFTSNVQRVVTDSRKLYKEIRNYLNRLSPHLIDKVELYDGNRSIFDEYGIEKELNKTNRKRINLPSGGDIVIEYTEAMTVIDVNSGKSSDKEQEKNSYKTNIDAAREVARQIRLRDLGGMILIDFIDMNEDQNKKKLFFEMKKIVMRDRAKVVVYPLTQLSIMQITRQRINQNISEKVTEICNVCRGTGRITSKQVIVNDIERWLRHFKKESNEFRLQLTLHPTIAEFITQGTLSTLSKLMIKYFVRIKLQQSDLLPLDNFKFYSIRQQKDITLDYQ